MTYEQLNKAKDLSRKIEEARENLEKIRRIRETITSGRMSATVVVSDTKIRMSDDIAKRAMDWEYNRRMEELHNLETNFSKL